MKVATSTGDFAFHCKDRTEQLRHVAEAGFRYVDLSLYTVKAGDPFFYGEYWQEEVEKLQIAARELGLTFVQAHAPDRNPMNGEQAYRDAVEKNIRAVEICGMLGIPNMAIHPGWRHGLTDKQQWFRENKHYFEEFFPYLEKHNVNMLAENTASVFLTDWYFPTSGKDLREFVQFVNHKNFHACWDTGHANVDGSQHQHLLDLGDEMYAIHFNDNRGRQDEHLIPYMGTMNVDEVLHALMEIGFPGPLTFECGAVLRPSNSWLGARVSFVTDTRLAEPPLVLQKELEAFKYSTGKYILETYGLFEE